MKCRGNLVLWGLLSLLMPGHSFFFFSSTPPFLPLARTTAKNNAIFHQQHGQPMMSDHPTKLSASNMDFDYSSTWAWEQYYREANESAVMEWHSSVSLADIASLVRLQLFKLQQSQHTPDTLTTNITCLVIGCGNSELPTVLRAAMPMLHVILLDSSSTCVDYLRLKFQDDAFIKCVCEDATQLKSLLAESVDIILDKGFLDALLCSEGWNGLVERAMTQAMRVLQGGGKYIWIGYTLPQSTLDYIAEIAPEIEWDNDICGCGESNENVAIRIGVKG
jgi:hypothetical protein